MSILQKWAEAIDSLNEQEMNDCLHDDYKFTLHSAGKVLSKSDIIEWAMSGDIERDNVRILFENDEVGVEHAVVSFKDGKHQVCAFKLLNTTISDNLTVHTTYRNHNIYKNDYFKIPATICNPQPEFACYIEDFIVLSSNIESLQNCISHFQNKTTLQHQNY